MNKIFKYIGLLISFVFLVVNFTPVYAEDKQQTTETNGTYTTKMNTELHYEVLAKVELTYGSNKIVYDGLHVGEFIKEPEAPERSGFKFIGWYDEETGQKWDFSKSVTRHMKLIAKYEKLAIPTKAVNTGDRGNISSWLILMTAAVMVVLMVKKESEV